jgi:hypothetical protein
MQLRDDPRADPRMLAAMASLGLDVAAPPPAIDAGAAIEHLREFAAETEAGFGAAFAALITALPPVKGVSSASEVIRGADGNAITLFIHRPWRKSPMPGMLPSRRRMVIGAAARSTCGGATNCRGRHGGGRYELRNGAGKPVRTCSRVE